MLDELRRRCAAAGFDLVGGFDVGAWNVAAIPGDRLPDLGRAAPLGVVVGNSRALWPVFLAACRADPALAAAADPLDAYTTAAVTAAATGVDHVALWAHRLDPRPIPIQRIAAFAGLALLSPSHLGVHRTFGPWIALRAVLVLDAPSPPPAPPPPHPCAGCPAPCLPALDRALAAGAQLDAATWRRWLAVRDACPVGREHRYPDAQIRYHYAREGLAAAIADP